MFNFNQQTCVFYVVSGTYNKIEHKDIKNKQIQWLSKLIQQLQYDFLSDPMLSAQESLQDKNILSYPLMLKKQKGINKHIFLRSKFSIDLCRHKRKHIGIQK